MTVERETELREAAKKYAAAWGMTEREYLLKAVAAELRKEEREEEARMASKYGSTEWRDGE